MVHWMEGRALKSQYADINIVNYTSYFIGATVFGISYAWRGKLSHFSLAKPKNKRYDCFEFRLF